MNWTHKAVVNNIKSHVDSISDLVLLSSGSLPLDTDTPTRLTTVDILVSKNENISHIIEVETSTDGTTIAGKLILANEAIKMMIDKNIQSNDKKPKIIYLYNPGFSNIDRVKYRVGSVIYHLKYIEYPVIEFYTSDWHKYL